MVAWLWLGIAGGPLAGQSGAGAVRGLVVALESGDPLAGARVTVVGGRMQAETDSAGVFLFPAFASGVWMLRIEFDGRAGSVERVVVEPDRVTGVVFQLPLAAHVLDALTVTRPSATGHSGSVISSEDATASTRTVGDMLSNVTGVQLIRGSGQVGQRYSVRIRGVKSVTFNGPPVVYIDGIRVTDGLGGGGVLDLISPTDIGTIEVLKGPAAAIAYGSEATNGVILVTTKRGSDP